MSKYLIAGIALDIHIILPLHILGIHKSTLQLITGVCAMFVVGKINNTGWTFKIFSLKLCPHLFLYYKIKIHSHFTH
jgi:hypothetical protein